MWNHRAHKILREYKLFTTELNYYMHLKIVKDNLSRLGASASTSKAFVASSLRSRLVPTEAPPFPARTDLPRPRRPRPSSSASSSPCGRTRTRVILAGGQASLRIVCAGVRSSLRLVTDGPRPSPSCSPRGRSVVLAGGRRASLLLLLRCTTHEGCGGVLHPRRHSLLMEPQRQET